MCSSRVPVGVLSPRTSDCDLIWREGPCRGNQAEMRSLGRALGHVVMCPYTQGKSEHRQRKMVWRPPRPPKLGEWPGTHCPTAISGTQLCGHLDGTPPASRTESQEFTSFEPPACGALLDGPANCSSPGLHSSPPALPSAVHTEVSRGHVPPQCGPSQ